MGIGEHRAAAYFPLNAEALKLRSSQGNVKVDAIHIGHATTSCLGEKVIKMQHAFLIKDWFEDVRERICALSTHNRTYTDASSPITSEK